MLAKSPTTQFPVQSSTTEYYEVSSSPPCSHYQSEDIAQPDVIAESQPRKKIKPKPMPKSKSLPENYYSQPDVVISTENSNQCNGSQKMYPAGNERPRPVRAPPRPPKTKPKISSGFPAAEVRSPSNLTIPTGLTVETVPQTSDIYERPPSPAPPPRPPRPPSSNYHSSLEYEQKLPDVGLVPSSVIGHSSSAEPVPFPVPARRSLSPSAPPVPDKPKLGTSSRTAINRIPSVVVMHAEADVPPPPPRPPKPGQVPAPSQSHSLSRPLLRSYEYITPQQDSEQLTQRQPIRRGTGVLGQTVQPPPPSFSPPPPPMGRGPAGMSSIASTSRTQPLYIDLDGYDYLDVLPDETHHRNISQSDSVLTSVYKPGTALGQVPPALGQNGGPPPQKMNGDTEDLQQHLRWLHGVRYLDSITSVYGLSLADEIRQLNQMATSVNKALHLFNLLMIKRKDALWGQLSELTAISNSLDKMQKKTKTMDIAGGTTGAVGGVAAVVGIALAPVTMGISLVATAVGAGMVASAGGMGAHAVKMKKKKLNKTQVEKIVQDYKINIVDVECCLMFIRSGMDELRRHDLRKLQEAGAHPGALRVAGLSKAMFERDNGAFSKNSAHTGDMCSERLLQAFMKEIDLYFNDKAGQKLKKGAGTKFASRLSLLVRGLQEVLDEINHTWEILKKF